MAVFVSALACNDIFTQAELDAANREVSGTLPTSLAIGATVTHSCKAGFTVADNPAENNVTVACISFTTYTELLDGTTRTAEFNKSLSVCVGKHHGSVYHV